MKEKVLAILKHLLQTRGFKTEEIEGLANLGVKNLTDASTDEEITNVVNGMIPYADMMQKVGNRYASSVEKKYEGYVNPTPAPDPNPNPVPNPTPPPVNPTPAVSMEDIQKLINQGIAEGLKPYQEKEERQRLQTILNSHDKVKSIPEAFRSKYTIAKEEELETVASQMETDYATLKQELIISGVFAEPPASGGAAGESDDLMAALKQMGAEGNK